MRNSTDPTALASRRLNKREQVVEPSISMSLIVPLKNEL